MLADVCPRRGCNMPLMRSRQGRDVCCTCRADVVTRGNNASNNQTEPSTEHDEQTNGVNEANGIATTEQLNEDKEDNTNENDKNGSDNEENNESSMQLAVTTWPIRSGRNIPTLNGTSFNESIPNLTNTSRELVIRSPNRPSAIATPTSAVITSTNATTAATTSNAPSMETTVPTTLFAAGCIHRKAFKDSSFRQRSMQLFIFMYNVLY